MISIAETFKNTCYEIVESRCILFHVRCRECGREVILSPIQLKAIRKADSCRCDHFYSASFNVDERKQKPEWLLAMDTAHLNERLIRRGLKSGSVTLAQVLGDIGPRPESTDVYEWKLTINDEGRFCWKRSVRTGVAKACAERSPVARAHANHILRSVDESTMRELLKTGVQYTRAMPERYQRLIGKIKHGVVIEGVEPIFRWGVFYYFYRLKCTRCGAVSHVCAHHIYNRRTSVFCRKCDKAVPYVHKSRNSAISSGNPFNRFRMRLKPELAIVSIADRLSMYEYIGFYSLNAIRPETIEENVEIALYMERK